MIHALLAFVTWPSQKGSSKTLGILGSSSFGDHMASLERSAHSSSIKTIQSYSLKSLEACDAIFICTSEEERLSGILRSLQGRPVLTLSDTPGFAQRGVMVNMVLWGDRIALEVNLPALRRADLCLSSAVLNHAKLVAR